MVNERIEEIKKDADEFWIKADNARGQEAHLSSQVFTLCDYISYLLKDLEEAQKQLTETREYFSIKQNQVWVLSKKLEEARQQSAKWSKAFDNADRQYLKMEHKAAQLRRRLIGKTEELAEKEAALKEILKMINYLAHKPIGVFGEGFGWHEHCRWIKQDLQALHERFEALGE
ncbi:hypothetical protein [Paenibacillus medicaginis]|uniref:Uncharacterized protein n=1 Tax=Paenibacillus medicaginis TaxID=1470560 RepID=A0ABV5BUI1_9BACL